MKLANTNDEGQVVPLSTTSQVLSRENFTNVLETSSVFQSGYEKYEQLTHHSVVPVTGYFFRYVYSDEERDLDALTETDLVQSLPKRNSYARDKDGKEIHHAGEPRAKYGQVAGIVIFPTGSAGNCLIRAWQERKAAGVIGSVEKLAEALSHSHLGANIEGLTQAADLLRRHVQQALPKPLMTSGIEHPSDMAEA